MRRLVLASRKTHRTAMPKLFSYGTLQQDTVQPPSAVASQATNSQVLTIGRLA